MASPTRAFLSYMTRASLTFCCAVTHVLTRLGLFDTLREGKTMSAAELASALKVRSCRYTQVRLLL